MGRMFPAAPARAKKVAVVGGGPAGMYAAITAAKRGHAVTMFERDAVLGGQLNHVDVMPFKWPLRNYRDWLIDQLGKNGVSVRLGTAADAALLEAEGFEAVIAACGAVGAKPASVPGGESALLPMTALKNIDSLGQKVVVVGGGEIGLETGLAAAADGRKVTVLSRWKHIPCDMHTMKALLDYMRGLPDFAYLTECRTEEIGAGFVRYTDGDGAEHRIDCDTVIFSGGRAAELSQGAALAENFPETYIIGDGLKPATVREAVYSAYCAAMRL